MAVNFGSPSIELTPLTQLCAPLTTQVVEGRDYSVLIGICPMKRGQLPDAILDLPFLWRDVPHWLLYPDLEDLKSTQPTPTPTPTPIPTVRPDYSEKPPLGPGAEVGTVYPYSLYLHCGVRDAYFDGRRWMALDVPEEWQLNAPAGWTRDDANGQMTLVEGDLAVFTSNTGRTIKFVPWPSDVPWGPCV